jgi:hypothetical protein
MATHEPKFPRGRHRPDGTGRVDITITTEADSEIVLEFDRSVKWIAFSAEEARGLARSLLERAIALDDRQAARTVRGGEG